MKMNEMNVSDMTAQEREAFEALARTLMASGLSKSEIIDRLKAEVQTQDKHVALLEKDNGDGTYTLLGGTVYVDRNGDVCSEDEDWICSLTVAPGVEFYNNSGLLTPGTLRSRKEGDWIVGGWAARVKYSIGSIRSIETVWGLIGNEQDGDTFTVAGLPGASQYSATSFQLFSDVVKQALSHCWEWHPQDMVVADLSSVTETVNTGVQSRASRAVGMQTTGTLKKFGSSRRQSSSATVVTPAVLFNPSRG